MSGRAASDKPSVKSIESNASSGTTNTQASGRNRPYAWFCPSRWVLAHHDAHANIETFSSHMCLADLHSDGENLLALVDFKRRYLSDLDSQQVLDSDDLFARLPVEQQQQAPSDCRLRIYRKNQLIYNHFLDDLPCCLIATSLTQPIAGVSQPRQLKPASNFANQTAKSIAWAWQRKANVVKEETSTKTASCDINPEKVLLALAINEDVYFYYKLKPSHRLTLEDSDCVIESINKSEYDTWLMVMQNKVADVETMRELLVSLSEAHGNEVLTSHTNNFLSLDTPEQRKNYLLAWKAKKFSSGSMSSMNLDGKSSRQEQIMSMDTICCAAARLKYTSAITRSGDYGLTHNQHKELMMNSSTSVWLQKIIDIQRDGLVLGTEDRHLLIYELRGATRTRLEAHCRLPSEADHILVERPSPDHFDHDIRQSEFKTAITYKIIVSCRNCRIYCIDQPYLCETKSISEAQIRELVVLKCNVLDMCWSAGDDCDDDKSGPLLDTKSSDTQRKSNRKRKHSNIIVACLNRTVYCFHSFTGQCKWSIKMDSPVSCLVGLPKLELGSNESASLTGIATQANRIDFYINKTGRIVDSIYLNGSDYCQAMVFGRFDREDNCLCIATNLGHLLIFTLKKGAKFIYGQCLSSAASYASDVVGKLSREYSLAGGLGELSATLKNPNDLVESTGKSQSTGLRLDEPASVPSAFKLAKSGASKSNDCAENKDQVLNLLNTMHSCDRVSARNALDAQLVTSQLQIPTKGRDFVEQIVDQSRNSTGEYNFSFSFS